MTERKVREDLEDLDDVFDFDGEANLAELLGVLQARLAATPEACRAGLMVAVRGGGDDARYTAVWYMRPPSGEELDRWQRLEAARSAGQEAAERATYERLKAKFEPKE